MIGWRDGGLAAAVAANLAVMFGCLGASAQEQPVRAPACGGEAIARGSAARIVDSRTFALEDGREVRLAAIEVPPLVPPKRRKAALRRETPSRRCSQERTSCCGVPTSPATGTAGSSPTRPPRATGWNAGSKGNWSRRSRRASATGSGRANPQRTFLPRTGGAQGQAWPLGRFVL